MSMAKKPSIQGAVLLTVAFAVRAALAQTPGAELEEEVPEVATPGGLVVLDEVRVESRRSRDIQQAVTEVVSLLSAEDIARTGEGDIAGALSFLPGLSVVGGGFVYVRGLGDRYSLALLNGSPLPSPEPLRRAVPLNLFPTDVIASSLVQKTYSPNYPGEFGGGVINLTTLAVPKTPFLKFGVGVSGDSETTGQVGYDHFGGKYDWTGYDAGARDVPPNLAAYFAGGQPITSLPIEQRAAIASEFVSWRNGAVQKIGDMPPNWSGTLTGGSSWALGGGELGFIGTAGYTTRWRTRDNVEQTPGIGDEVPTNKDFRSVASENNVVANALLGLGYESGEHRLRWTNLYIHDTLKRTSLAAGRWHVDSGAADLREQSTAWYERELLSTQLAGSAVLGPVTLSARGAYSTSKRDAPYELSVSYARSNDTSMCGENRCDPYGDYFVNILSGQRGNQAGIAFSELDEDLYSGGVDLSWRVAPGYVLSLGYDRADTRRVSERREFLFRAPSNFNKGVGLLRPDYLLSPDVISYYRIDIQESTISAAAFGARLLVDGAYLQLQALLAPDWELAAGARYEQASQRVNPIEVFNTPTNTGLPTNLNNDYVLPAATLTWKFGETRNQQIRLNASQTIARPQFRELMFQRYFDPEGNRTYFGNPLLKDSEFINGEARYEWYFATEQRFSVAGFYKKIDRPIEAYTTYPQGDPETSFANAPEATLYGVELDLQKYFRLDGLGNDFLSRRRLVVTGNYTWTNSSVHVGEDDTADIPGALNFPARFLFRDGAKMTGQSDHLVNLQLGLERPDRLSQVTLIGSYSSDRVTSRVLGWSDILESPGLKLDLVARQGLDVFGRNMELKLEARNLLGRGYREFQRNGGNIVFYNKYDIGTSFGLSVSMDF